MALEKMTKSQLQRYSGTGGYRPYVDVLKDLKVGEGGKATTKTEKCTKQTIKNRLNASAQALGMKLKYKRSPADEVVFEVSKAAG